MKKKKKEITVSRAKEKAWTIFSRYIRWKYADENGLVGCVTCGSTLPVEAMQAGHFIPGRKNSILYNELGVHPQCYTCNIILKGNPRKYHKFMEERYGKEVISELDNLSDKVIQMKAKDHLEVYEKYNSLLNRLKNWLKNEL